MLPFALAAAAACTAAGAPPSRTVTPFLTTTDQRHLFERQGAVPLQPVGPHPRPPANVVVNTSATRQRMVGFGAAVTDAAAWVLSSAPPALSDELLSLLFKPFAGATDDDGRTGAGAGAPPSLGISVVRVPMGVSDFSVSYADGNITYADTPGDWSLSHFSTAHDDAYILPVLRAAKTLNPDLVVIASPWTAPLWLKDPPGSAPNNLGAGTLLNTSQAYDTYAEYFVKFVLEYKQKGVAVDYLTLQNEPGHGGCGPMPCMLLPEPAEARLAVLVGQKLAAAGLADTRILGYDHNWGNGGNAGQPGPEYPTALLNDSAAAMYVAGVAWHCYGGDVTAQTPVHDLFPSKEVHMTECSGGTWSGLWASNFVNNVRQLFVGNANNWGQSTLLWNMALDGNAGPHCQGGACCTTCRGVVTVPSNAKALSDVTLNVEFYSLAHFSSLVPPGSRVVESIAPGGHATCTDYCASTGCGWTKQWSCPWAPAPGTSGRAGNDGSVGYHCCCVDRTSEPQPCGGNATSGTPLEFAAFATPEARVVLAAVNPTQDNQTMVVEVDGVAGFEYVVPPGAATLSWDAAA